MPGPMPNVRDGAVPPDLRPESLLVEDADAIWVVLGGDVEGDLGEEEVGSDAGGGGDARTGKHRAAQLIGELARGEPVE